MKKHAALFLVVFGLASTGFGSADIPVFKTRVKPMPKAGEQVKTYKPTFQTCKQLSSKVIYACPAYGVLGMRLCYVKAKGPTYYVAKNEFVPHLGNFNGNDCMERFRIMRHMCKTGVESGKFDTMYCLQ